jgi:HAD superfamily hydrolase (TIGR01490 family)
MSTQKKFAVFDIDGTLVRWQLYHGVVAELAKAGLVSAARVEAMNQAHMTWRTRKHVDSFRTYELEVVKAYDEAITNMPVKAMAQAIDTIFNEYKDQVYTYTRDLIRSLKEKGYLLFAISASPSEIIGLVADYYGFDDFGGSVYEQKGGRLTGSYSLLKRETKPLYLEMLVTKHNATFTGSIGVGDSDGDIQLLSRVENPIAFNPNRLLFDYAKQHNWKVVVERKNMVYELEAGDGSYILA